MEDRFPALLRDHRVRRRLTQEALAERAGVSARSIGELERGRAPRPDTLGRLAAALELAGNEGAEFRRAGRELFWSSRSGRRDRPGSASGRRPEAGAVCQLPADLPDFVGRDEELDRLAKALRAGGGPRLVVISGPPGVGKSALAVHAAHRLSSRFPDGQLYAVLRGVSPHPADPADVLDQLLRVLGVDGSAMPAGVEARAGMFRARLAGRRMLVVLDDAAGHSQVEPLLPAVGAALIVTSRAPLTGLSGVRTMDLPALPTKAAVRLLGRVAGMDRVRGEPAAAVELVSSCGRLPLAVRIAGARLAARPHWTVGALAERLTNERRRLDELSHGDLAVRSGLELAYRGISPDAAQAFALLGELGLPTCPEWPIAALLGATPEVGTAVLDELVHARLLDHVGPDQAGQHRYRFHDLTRLYARERRAADVPEPAWQAALSRVASGWLALARQAGERMDRERLYLDDPSVPAPPAGQWANETATARPVEWFEVEREALASLVSACVEAGLMGIARCLAGCAAEFYCLRGYFDDWRRVMETALAGCRRAEDRRGEAAMLRGLGRCLVEGNDQDTTLSTLRSGVALAERVGDRAGAALARKEIGHVLAVAGRLEEAVRELRGAVAELARADRPAGHATALYLLGFALIERGEVAEALATVRSGWTVAEACGDVFAQAYALRGLAGALRAAGRFAEAEQASRRSVALFKRVGDSIGVAQGLRGVGEAIARDPRRLAEAERVLVAAAARFREAGYGWGVALTELILGEIGVRRGSDRAAELLRRSLRYWTEAGVPALEARALAALADAAAQSGDPDARELLMAAFHRYHELGAPQAAELAARLGLQVADTRSG